MTAAEQFLKRLEELSEKADAGDSEAWQEMLALLDMNRAAIADLVRAAENHARIYGKIGADKDIVQALAALKEK